MSVTLTLSPSDTVVVGTDQALTLKEKWQTLWKKKTVKRSPAVPRAYFCGMAASMLYSGLFYLIPYNYNHLGEYGVYCMKVLVCFLCFNSVANFLCLIFYDTSIKKTKDRPGLPRHLWNKPPDRFIPYLYKSSANGGIAGNGISSWPDDVDSKDDLPWGYCTICELDLPPRGIHCSTCGKCILKRDHHCYLTGVCVGHYNQRYFLMLAFYTLTSCAWGFWLTYHYVMANCWDQITRYDFFPPYSFYRTLFGYMECHVFIMVNHLWILPLFAFAGFVYFTGQIVLVTLNKTLYEFTKKDPYRCTNSFSRNFRIVFGDFWGLNFLFPAQILFRQKDDGFHWEGLKLNSMSQFDNKKGYLQKIS